MPKPTTIIIAGPRFSGKSRFVENLLPEFRGKGLTPTGFFQRGTFDGDGVKTGYSLVSAETGSAVPLARRAAPCEPWEFDHQAFDRAAGMVSADADICILDEIGPLELSGSGHAAVLEQALRSPAPLILVVREELAGQLRERASKQRDATVVEFTLDSAKEIAARIIELLES